VSRPRVLLIVPAYNEGGGIGEVLDELLATLRDDEAASGYELDLLVVDDCSRDDTRARAEARGVQVVSLPVNLGIGGAMQTGFRHAVRHDYDFALQVDGDGQHHPGDITKLLGVARASQADLTIGSRFAGGVVEYRPPLARRIGMALSRVIVYLGTGTWVRDTTSGFRVLSRRMLALFAEEYPTTLAGVISIVLAVSHGRSLVEKPARFRTRTSGQSSINLGKAFFYPFQIVFATLGVVLRARKARR
jgi:glycosyltransferase involved in cell wall biosynthesis